MDKIQPLKMQLPTKYFVEVGAHQRPEKWTKGTLDIELTQAEPHSSPPHHHHNTSLPT